MTTERYWLGCLSVRHFCLTAAQIRIMLSDTAFAQISDKRLKVTWHSYSHLTVYTSVTKKGRYAFIQLRIDIRQNPI